MNCAVNLKAFVNNKIYRGVTTGLNKAFVINEQNKDDIINNDPKSMELIKKYYKSTKIGKYKVDWHGEWFIFTKRGTNVSEYTGIKEYLSKFKKELEPKSKKSKGPKCSGRKPGSYKWFEIQDNVAYYEEFEKPKIIYIHTAKAHQFYYDEEGYFINNSCYMIVADNKFLFFYLNSTLFDWFKRIKFVAYGDADEAGRVKLDYNKMITVPIKQITDKQLKWFEKQYTAIKSVLSNAPKVKILEQEAETQLFKIYELTYKEVKTVCSDFWLSETEYNNFKTA